MLKAAAPRIANVLLRGLSTASRFALILALAKLLEPAELGIYGLFTATVAFSMLLIGADYYTYAQRELLTVDRRRWSFVLQHQAIAAALLYSILLPAQLLLFWLGLLPGEYLFWFFLLLIAEHLSQEINRLLIAMQRPLTASWVLFLRLGAWVWPLLAAMWLQPRLRTLEAVFLAWLIGTCAATVTGGLIVMREAAPWRRWPVDRVWLRRGFGVGFLFLTATLCFKALTTVDRYLVDLLAGADLLGVYVLYIGLSMAIPTFLEPAVYSFLYPRIVRAHRQGDATLYQQLMKELTWSSIGLSVVLAGIIAVAAPFVLEWTGRVAYLEHLHLLWLLLIMAVLYSVSMVPHYGLYARGADRTIVAAHVSSLLVFAAVVAIAAPHAPLEATAYGLVGSLVWMGTFKLVCYRRRAHDDGLSYPNGGEKAAPGFSASR